MKFVFVLFHSKRSHSNSSSEYFLLFYDRFPRNSRYYHYHYCCSSFIRRNKIERSRLQRRDAFMTHSSIRVRLKLIKTTMNRPVEMDRGEGRGQRGDQIDEPDWERLWPQQITRLNNCINSLSLVQDTYDVANRFLFKNSLNKTLLS